jgi:predicted nucleic acid-binding Zn ribbon protein
VRDPVPLTSSLDGVMRSLRGVDRRQIAGVFGRWEDAVGAGVAAHVRPVKFDRSVLTVEADDAAWATETKFISGRLIERLAEVADVRVERIEVRVAGGRERDR